MSAPALTGIRWSSVRDCPRKAVLETTGVEQRDWYDREERVMFRGKRLEDDYAAWLEREHPDWTLERQVVIPWPLGEGHADIYAVEPSVLFEVLSSAHASGQMIESKLVQLAGYLEHYPRAGSGRLVILNPSDFSEESIPVLRNTRAYADLKGEVAERVAAVQAWSDTGLLPGRVCRKPSDAIGHFCRVAAPCFEGWEPPDLEQIDNPEARRIVVQLAHAKESEREGRGTMSAAETRRKELEAELADYVPVGEHRVGSFKVVRSHTSRNPTIDVRKVAHAGVVIPDECWKPGAEYDTWKVEPIDGAAVPEVDDYGPVPF